MLQSDFLLRQPATSSPLHGLVPVVPSLRVWQAGRLMLGVPVGGWKVWPLNSPAGWGGWGSEGQPWVRMEGPEGWEYRFCLPPRSASSDGSATEQPFPHTPSSIPSLILNFTPPLILTLNCVHSHRTTESSCSLTRPSPSL